MGEPQIEVEVGWLCETGEAGGTEGERWSLCVLGVVEIHWNQSELVRSFS